MMLRLTFATRLALITLVSLLVAWIVAIAANYRFSEPQVNDLPDPAQLVALTVLLENPGPEVRDLALRTATSSTFLPRLAGKQDDEALSDKVDGEDAKAATDAELKPYADALKGRAVEMRRRPISVMARRFPRLFGARALGLTQFRIPLSTGEILIVDAVTTGADPNARLPVGFGAGLLGTLIALGALVVMQRETRPLTQLAAAVDRVNLTGPFPPLPQARGRAPEIKALIGAIDRLQRRLDSVMRSRMALLGGISHDIRTFATRLRLRVDHIGNETERDRAVSDIDDMIHLLDDALLASRANAGELQEEMIDVAALVKTEYLDRLVQGALITYAAEGGETTVLGDRLALRRIFANATDNALKYGRAAHLAVRREYDVVAVTIDDDGPGIPPEHKELMLEPFTRLETSRSRETGGAGLGLAIIRNLSEMHGGSVDIDTSPMGGARLTIHLPLFDAGSF